MKKLTLIMILLSCQVFSKERVYFTEANCQKIKKSMWDIGIRMTSNTEFKHAFDITVGNFYDGSLVVDYYHQGLSGGERRLENLKLVKHKNLKIGDNYLVFDQMTTSTVGDFHPYVSIFVDGISETSISRKTIAFSSLEDSVEKENYELIANIIEKNGKIVRDDPSYRMYSLDSLSFDTYGLGPAKCWFEK